MSVRCASCGRHLPGMLPRTSWCPECKTLSCNMCRPSDYNRCPVCGTESHGKDYFALFFAVSVGMIVVTVIFSGMSAYDLSKQIPAEMMPTSGIGALHPGEHVKVEGKLEGNGTIAIDGAMKDGDWEFITRSVMLRSLDDNTSIMLQISSGSDIYKGPHRSEKTKEVGRSVYWTNDTIVAVGTTARNDTNDTVLMVELLRPYDGTFLSDFSIWTGVYIQIVIWMAMAVFLAFNLRLKRISERTIDSPGFVFKRKTLMEYQPSITSTTMINGRMRVNKIVLSALLTIDALITLALIILFYTRYISINGSGDAFLAIFLPYIFPVVFTFMFIREYRSSPKSVSIDNKGFAFDFGHRKEGYRWNEVSSLEAPYRNAESKWLRDPLIKLTLEDSREIVFGNISAEISDSLTGRFKKERPDSGPPDILEFLTKTENIMREAQLKAQAAEESKKAPLDDHISDGDGQPPDGSDISALSGTPMPLTEGTSAARASKPRQNEKPAPGRFMNSVEKKTSRRTFWAVWGIIIGLVAGGFIGILFVRGDVLVDLVTVCAAIMGILLALAIIVSVTYWYELSRLVEWMEFTDSELIIKLATGQAKKYPWNIIRSLTVMERDERLPSSSTRLIISVPKDFLILKPIEPKLAENARRWYEEKGDSEPLRLKRRLESAKEKGATPLEMISMMRQGIEEMRKKE